jgi:hypothetical protein
VVILSPIIFYRCAKCGCAFDDYTEAKACESAHLIPVSVEVKQYAVQPFPYSVEVTFNNGEKRIYNAEALG